MRSFNFSNLWIGRIGVLVAAALFASGLSAQSTSQAYNDLRVVQPNFAQAVALDEIPEVIQVAAISSKVRVVVDKSEQRMRVYVNGFPKYTWKVSTGRRGYSTPTGTWKPTRMHRYYRSKKYDAQMNHAIFFKGGYAIHQTGAVRQLGRVASHGCVRLSPKNASRLFKLVKRYGRANTRITVKN